jgi:4-amino-4-deoxy-L-arabinose transferase-like glycosyltransferase
LSSRPGRRELGVLLAILVLAALTRLPGLDARGAWDADQGQDMLVLDALVHRGEIPLLGPRTSVGTFHHGAVYYYLLAPAAAISGSDPVAVTGEIALFGIAAVAAVWWLARLIGGPLAAAAAGLLAAVSPAGIDESTFIWNPNLIPLAAGLAFAAALQAWQSRQARWWLLSALGAMVTMQCHVLGVVALPPLVLVWVLDVRRRRSSGESAAPLLRAGAGAVAIIVAGYLPLVAHDLTHDFSETRAILAYLTGGGSGSAGDGGPLGRIAIVGLRSITWPFVGLISERIVASMLAVLVIVGLGVLTLLVGRRADRRAALWLVGSIGWSVVALGLFAPSLATITPGLPNDHYHAFLDPLVLALTGAGLARLATLGAPLGGRLAGSGLGRLAPVSALLGGLLLVLAVIAWPPAVSPDGGWALVDRAAERVINAVDDQPFALDGIPPFKSANAVRFPLEHRGVTPLEAGALQAAVPPATAVVVCDPLFADVVGAACGGPAESAWAEVNAPGYELADRFDAGSRRVISIYVTTP